MIDFVEIHVEFILEFRPVLFPITLQYFVVDQVLFHGFRCDCHGSRSVIVVDI